MKKVSASIIGVVICLLSFFWTMVPASAASTVVLSPSTYNIATDTLHGTKYIVNGYSQRALNRYTSGSVGNNTKVTTWTFDATDGCMQWDKGWIEYYDGVLNTWVSTNDYVMFCQSNKAFVLDFARNYTYPDVRLYAWANNYYDDVALSSSSINYGSTMITMQNRSRSILVTSTQTSVYNANGYTCQWNPTGTYFIHSEI